MVLDVLVDGCFELWDTMECRSSNALVGDVAEPALDEVEP